MGSISCKRDYTILVEDDELVCKQMFKRSDNRNLTMNVVLMGRPNVGKNTIIKQIRMHYTKNFKKEFKYNRQCVYRNLIEIFHSISIGIYQMDIEIPEHEKNLVYKFYSNSSELFYVYEEDQLAILRQIRIYTCVEDFLRKSMVSYLPDNASYFLNELNRILSIEYEPNFIDFLYIKESGKKIKEICFATGLVTMKVANIGHSMLEYRKWVNCFDETKTFNDAILFVASLTDYNKFSHTDNTKNCLESSLEVFHELFQIRYFQQVYFILILNKEDIFKKDFANSTFKFKNITSAPQYDNNAYKSTLKYIKDCFTMNLEKKHKTEIYTHVTVATNSTSIKNLFETLTMNIIETILTKFLMAEVYI